MIRVEPVPEPDDFDEKVRKKGKKWLAEHTDWKRPYDLWSQHKHALADGFGQRCGYLAMWVPDGTVDHFVSVKSDSDLIYEWSNYRYISGWLNSSKKRLDDAVLDPYAVDDAWFEILLPSLQLVLTDEVPESEREKAAFTLRRLHLRDDERVLRQRREWYRMYQEGELSLEGLRKKAPLIARAVDKQASAVGTTEDEDDQEDQP